MISLFSSIKEIFTGQQYFEKQYKEVLSGFREWDQLDRAEEWLLFPDNTGPRLAIDESSLSNGELYTFVTNRDARTRE